MQIRQNLESMQKDGGTQSQENHARVAYVPEVVAGQDNAQDLVQMQWTKNFQQNDRDPVRSFD